MSQKPITRVRPFREATKIAPHLHGGELFFNLAYPEGFEPTTFGVGGQHSIQLSYGYIKTEILLAHFILILKKNLNLRRYFYNRKARTRIFCLT